MLKTSSQKKGRAKSHSSKTAFSQIEPVIMIVYRINVFSRIEISAADSPSPVNRNRITSVKLHKKTRNWIGANTP